MKRKFKVRVNGHEYHWTEQQYIRAMLRGKFQHIEILDVPVS